MITRRRALKNLGVAAGAAAVGPRLVGCGGGGNGGGPDGGPVFPPGITHFVEICMENRTYDHVLGVRKLMGLPNAGNGLDATMSNKRLDGTDVLVHPAGDDDLEQCVTNDPPHGWEATHAQWNNGLLDGFMTEQEHEFGAGVRADPMTYLLPKHMPWTHALAEKATVCDNWFCALLGPTWPNRLYLHSAQSGGLITNTIPDGGFNWPTVYHEMLQKQIPFTYYWSDLPVAGLWEDIVTPYSVRRISEFFDDCAAGTLPPMVVVEPAFSANDDHPPHHPMLGQLFLASVYTALANSPHWNNTLILITYDEHGGFYDHVPPPTAPDDRAADGFGQLGFRVPTIVTGPYAKQGYLSSLEYNHGSVPKHIETMFGLSALTMRDEAARDLSDCIDAARLAAEDPAPPLDLPPITVDETMIDDACYKRSPRYAKYEQTKSDIEKLADTGYFGEYDKRKEIGDTLKLYASVLEKYGKGGIVKGGKKAAK